MIACAMGNLGLNVMNPGRAVTLVRGSNHKRMDPVMADATDIPIVISRQAAKEYGLTQFFTGRPCKRGHVSKRNVASGGCLACMRLTDRFRDPLRKPAYFQNNKERIQAKNREWADNNREKATAYTKKWREANREKFLLKQREWRDSNPEYAHQWYQDNLTKAVVSRHKRRAAVKNAEGSFTEEDIQLRLRLQRQRCAICKCSIASYYEVDHIVPLARGGSNWPSNLQLTCRPCNRAKRAKDPIDFMRGRGMLL